MPDHTSASLGILGQYYSVRHALGQYRSAGVTAAYSVSSPEKPDLLRRLCFALERSVQATIRQHPGLRFGVSDEKSAGIPLFRQLHQIDREDVLEIIRSHDARSTGGESDDPTADTTLSRVLGDRHAMTWPSNKPAWRVVVLEHLRNEEGADSDQVVLERLDIAFLAHHAIADGTSGLSFHTSLMKNLRDISATTYQPTWPMTLNEIRDAPAAVEECVDCLSCACTLCNASNTCHQQAWAGAGVSPESRASFKSMVRVVTIPAHRLSGILQRCKRSNVTLTGLLHALICASLCRGIPVDHAGFRAVTPFSVRRHTEASDEDIVNHISFLTSHVPVAQLHEIEKCEPGSASEEHAVIQLAELFGRDMATKVREFPHGCMAVQLSRIQDLLSHCRNQSGKQRQYTYELSNLGLSPNVVPPKGSGLKLEKVFFTQCGMVTGPAIGFNCVSVRGGPLTISITWQQGVVEESLIEQVARDLERI